MNADLDALIRLQETHNRIAEFTARIETEIPGRVAELEKSLTEVRLRLEQEQLEIQAEQKGRARLELEMKTAEERITKYKAALMQVKNNDEYRAALNEIDYTTRAYTDIETRVLEIMETTESRRTALKELEARFKIEDEKIRADRKVLEAERDTLIHLRESEDAVATQIEAALPSARRQAYRRIASVRGGVALAIAREGVCLGCNMRLRPSVFQSVRRNEGVIPCDTCTRILYYVEESVADGDTVEPAASDQVSENVKESLTAHEGTGSGLH